MTSRLEFDLPAGDQSVPFGQLHAFVEHVYVAGAGPDTPVLAVGAEQDPSLLIALRVDFDQLAQRPADVRLDRADFIELMELLAEIDDNDGDARAHQSTVLALRQRLTRLALER